MLSEFTTVICISKWFKTKKYTKRGTTELKFFFFLLTPCFFSYRQHFEKCWLLTLLGFLGLDAVRWKKKKKKPDGRSPLFHDLLVDFVINFASIICSYILIFYCIGYVGRWKPHPPVWLSYNTYMYIEWQVVESGRQAKPVRTGII